jgi:multidrug efflux pump
MLARFFIDRPVFAWVISIVIVLIGLMAVISLPLAQYPDITPPTIQVACQYPGASAQVVADTIAAPIEQQINGVENMMYMSSQSNNDGSYSLTITFRLGVNLDTAQVLVQNRVNQALPVLPDVVKATGVTVKKQSPNFLLVINLYADDNPRTGKPYFDQLYLSNFATIQIKDAIARVDGVGDVFQFGQQDYSMRVWLDPYKLASRNLTATDVIKVLREQNVQVAAGQIGQPPVPNGLDFQYTMTTQGRLVDAKQFADIVVKTGDAGEVTYLKDVSRPQLGARSQDALCRVDGKPSVGLAVFQLPTSNALDTANRVKARMRELENRFPEHLKYAMVYDTTPFIHESVDEVVKTLIIAVLLVGVVVLLFLQDWRAVLLPLIDVVVSLVGTFAVMKLMGFTLNNLTLFGLVLAIGIVVDDAIVVLENIERWLGRGLAIREATIKAMDEITGPIIAITLVLSSVFLPSAFLGGITGQFFRQFALTIAVSMMISAVNAMTMTPARAAAIFRHRRVDAHGHMQGQQALPWWFFAILGGLASLWLLWGPVAPWFGLGGSGDEMIGGDPGSLTTMVTTWGLYAALCVPGAIAGGVAGWLIIRPVNWGLGWFFRGFNRAFNAATHVYGTVVGWSLRLAVVVLLVYVGLLGLTWYGFTLIPGGFIPNQDKGYLIVNVQLPDSSSQERTLKVMDRIQQIAANTEGVAHTVDIVGISFVMNGNSSNFGTMFITLKPFHQRRAPELYADVMAKQLNEKLMMEIKGAQIMVFGAPAVDGLGNAGGFKLMLESTGNADLASLEKETGNLSAKVMGKPGYIGLFSSFRAATPQLYVNVDRIKCKTMKVALNDVFDTLQVFLGGYYVNDFNRFGRTWQVNLQADAPYRLNADMVRQFKVRNADGDMVPLGSLATVRDEYGPVFLVRYNMMTATAINGVTMPTVSSGTVIDDMEKLCKRTLPRTMTYEWSELMYMQKETTRLHSLSDLLQNPFMAFVGAVTLVFLVLAALYESWSLPLSVILVVPMCLLCALAGVFLARMDLNIFVQVGFVVLVGLASKNAILIVEFARDRQQAGQPLFAATVEAARVRLRPIIMTSFAFILGVFPLVIASGAGAEMRRTLGTAVFAGMIGVTLFGIFLTPVFFFVVRGLTGRKKHPAAADGAHGVSIGLHPPEEPGTNGDAPHSAHAGAGEPATTTLSPP